jgi:hypothetical protein
MKIKVILSSIAVMAFLSACNTENQNEGLVSKWHLIEQLMDPGDGSGTFQPVTSDKTISFF